MRWASVLLSLGLLAGCDGGSAGPDPAAPVARAGLDLRGFVGEAIVLDGSASTGVSLRWDTGDGTIVDGAVVEHTYDRPGRYAAVLEVTGQDGSRITDVTSVLITHRPASPAPTRSSRLAVDSDGSVWAVVPEAGALVRISADGRDVRRIATCAGASALAIAGASLAVACPDQDQLLLHRTDAPDAQPQVVRLPTGARPVAVAPVPSEQAMEGPWVVALEGAGALAWIDLTGRVATTVPVGTDPRGLAVLPDGDAITSLFRAVDDTSRLVRVQAGGGAASVIELAYDPGPDTDTNARGVPHLIERLAVSPDGRTVYAPGVQANTARGPSRDGLPLTFETTLRAHLSVIDVADERELPERRKLFDDQGRALAVSVSPQGDRVWTAHPGTGVVHAVDAFTGALRGSILGAGRGIVGLRHTDQGDTLLVLAWLDRQVHAYDLTQDPPVRRWTADLLEREPLEPAVLRGKQLFWEAGDPRLTRAGYMACAHCHPDGDQDGLVWDFGGRGEGVRNTLSLHGRAGTGHGPLHWSANFDEVQDFEHDLRGPNGGRGLLSEADWQATSDPLGQPKAGRSDELDALAAYVGSLDRTPTSPHTAPAGSEQAFQAAGCPACHPSPTYTDSGTALHDVGTLTPASGSRLGGPLTGLDTPTLLGAWATPPYLHDGSAPTLADAILAHRGIELTDRELEQIVGFVRSL